MFEIYRTRPILAWSLTAIGGLFILYLFWPRQQAAASTGASGYLVPSGPSDAEISAATSFQIAQLQAAADSDARQASVLVEGARLETQRFIASLSADLEDRNAERAWTLQTQALETSREVSLADSAAEERMFNISLAAQDASDERAALLQGYLVANQTYFNSLLLNQTFVTTNTASRDIGSTERFIRATQGNLLNIGPPPVNPFQPTTPPPGG